MHKLLTRDQFRNGVFARDGNRCVLCGNIAQDAHHILERRLWPRMDMLSFEYLKDPTVKNRAAEWCGHDLGYRYCNVVQVRDHILELLLNGNRDLARELMVEHLKGKFVDTFMENTRKSWIPGGHEGSQAQEYNPHRALIASMNRVMDERDARYADEDGENEE